MVYVLFIVIALVSFAVQRTLQSKFERYSKIPIPYGLTGRDIAMRMLQENGINDVSVTQVDGHLTDHYNPATHTVNLSRDVYYGNSVAAAAVAAHECGHAVQHARSYSFPEFALGSCAVRELRFELGTVDFIDRDSHDTGLSGYYAIGYNFICCDDFV